MVDSIVKPELRPRRAHQSECISSCVLRAATSSFDVAVCLPTSQTVEKKIVVLLRRSRNQDVEVPAGPENNSRQLVPTGFHAVVGRPGYLDGVLDRKSAKWIDAAIKAAVQNARQSRRY
jgi:hypothetical protein